MRRGEAAPILRRVGWEVGRRGVAVGVVIGLAAAAETLRMTPALRSPAAIPAAAELAALFVALYAAIGLGVAIVLGALATAGRRLGIAPLERIDSASVLW